MKKRIIRIAVIAIVFIASLIITGSLINTQHDNLTMEMAKATFPVLTMEMEGVSYNELHGYAKEMDVAFQRDTVTVLGESRETDFAIETFGEEVTGVSIELRSEDGERLIEQTEITELSESKKEAEVYLSGTIALKDLIEKDTEYSLTILVEIENAKTIYYYTRVIWSDALYAAEKIAYVKDFHEKIFDKEAAQELTKYLETNSRLEDNSSFHKVNINSSLKQLTWGDMNVKEVGEPSLQLTEIASQTASFLVDYMVSTTEGRAETTYFVEEHYRIRYTTDRVYLLDYERTMTQIVDEDSMCTNDKIAIGIADEDVPMIESEDGNIVVFEASNRLFSYDATTNKLTAIFGFYDDENMDLRTTYHNHGLKLIDVDEGGNVRFAVFGYMNRGMHEGEVGIQLYVYNSTLNTIEELVYIPYERTYSVLAAELEQLLYVNRDDQMYLELENVVYCIDLAERSYEAILEITQDENLQVSENHRILVWPEGVDNYHSSTLKIRNLTMNTENLVTVDDNEAIRPIGFMEEDVIYGIAKKADIVKENSGKIVFPMYKIVICNASGTTLKEYEQEGIYISSIDVTDNLITLHRLVRTVEGDFEETIDDQITNNIETAEGKNKVVTVDIDTYERFVQIQTKNTIDTKSLKVLHPKELVYEGGRSLTLPEGGLSSRYYVYGPYGVDGMFTSPALAINLAYEESGVVVDGNGDCIWIKGNRSSRNQIMAIKEESVSEGETSLAVCLDTIFSYEGIVRNSQYLLGQGANVLEILEENLEGAKVLDLTGCSLDALLYYVNQDLPVLALLEDGEAVLVTGFNEQNVVIMEPSIGTLYKKGMNDSAEWFAENGNVFITYTRVEK